MFGQSGLKGMPSIPSATDPKETYVRTQETMVCSYIYSTSEILCAYIAVTEMLGISKCLWTRRNEKKPLFP